MASLPLLIALQPEPPQIMTNALSFFVTTAIIVLGLGVGLFFVMKSLKKKRDYSITAEIREEFEKSKETLLLAAQKKKASEQAQHEQTRAEDVEAKERELLKENVDPALVFGRNCPLSGLEMMEDQELVIDPYTGQGYHFSSFLNDWPKGQERPKYVYRYPMRAIVRSDDIIRGY